MKKKAMTRMYNYNLQEIECSRCKLKSLKIETKYILNHFLYNFVTVFVRLI